MNARQDRMRVMYEELVGLFQALGQINEAERTAETDYTDNELGCMLGWCLMAVNRIVAKGGSEMDVPAEAVICGFMRAAEQHEQLNSTLTLQ